MVPFFVPFTTLIFTLYTENKDDTRGNNRKNMKVIFLDIIKEIDMIGNG